MTFPLRLIRLSKTLQCSNSSSIGAFPSLFYRVELIYSANLNICSVPLKTYRRIIVIRILYTLIYTYILKPCVYRIYALGV